MGLNLVEAAETLLRQEEEAKASAAADPFIQEIEALIAERVAAKKAKDFARADAIRQSLADRGVTLIDTKEGTRFTVAEK